MNLKLKKFEVEEIWSWWNLKLTKFEVEEIWSQEIWSWRNLKLKNFNLKNLKLKKFEVWVRFKSFLERIYVDNQLTNEVNQLWFWKYCPIFFVFNSAKFGTFFALLRPFGAIFGVGVRFKNFFGTYLLRLTTFILEA